MIYRVGNLLDSNCDYICHQVNCQGKMNSGIAKSIREKWIEVYHSYMERFRVENSATFLGTIQDIQTFDGPHVINMFSQEYYGYDGRRYTSYDAFWNCLNLIKNIVPKGSKIGFPRYIGCVRGGANWNVIEAMIFEVLDEDYEVYIYCLEDNDHVSR
jgi:O-acetyl-ADP-ribose deacetylase (regulator of RNase III)